MRLIDVSMAHGERGGGSLARRRIAVLTVTGLTLVGLGAVTARIAHATAPGENGRIAFRRYFNDAHSRGAIFTIRPDGTGVVQVTHRGRDVLDTEPDWSPDGRWIAFARVARPEITGTGSLFKVRANGTHLTRLTLDPCSACPDEDPVWSPDGRWIAFTRINDRTGIESVFRMRADGSHVRQLIEKGVQPGWSPDGKSLVFERHQSGGRLAVFTARLDGTNEQRVSPWRLHAGDHPDWSPDGRWIVFHSNEERDGQRNVYLVHPNGNGFHRITNTFTHGSSNWLSYSFSPDGTMITVGHNLAGQNADVWVMNLDGSGLRDVTNSLIWDSAPDWGPRP